MLRDPAAPGDVLVTTVLMAARQSCSLEPEIREVGRMLHEHRTFHAGLPAFITDL